MVASAGLAASSEPLLDLQIAIDATGEAVAVWKEWSGGSVLGSDYRRDRRRSEGSPPSVVAHYNPR